MNSLEGPRAHVPLDDPRLRKKSDCWSVPSQPRPLDADPAILALEILARMVKMITRKTHSSIMQI